MNKNIVPGHNPNFDKHSWFTGHKILGYAFLLAILAGIVVGVYYHQTGVQSSDFFQSANHHYPRK